jgi:hypothetical protein
LIVIFSVSPDLSRSRLYFSGDAPSSDTIPIDGIWMANQPIAIRKFEKKCKNRNFTPGHCHISPFIDGGIIGEMGSIQSRCGYRSEVGLILPI